jgi:cytochrome c
MSMRKGALGLVAALAAGAAFAQEGVERVSAELPEILPETGERAPAPPPASSAEQVGEVDPAAGRFGIGHPISAEEIAAIDIDVMPDGAGLPAGSGTYADGEALYAQVCAACHGENLEGIADLGAPRLIGGRDTLATDAPVRTVESYWPHASTLFDYVHRAMPMDAPGSLAPDEVYAISAYILGRAGIVGEDAVLDAASFAAIEMPNADGFGEDQRPDAE